MVIENENAGLRAVRYLGRPVALPIPKDAEELARRHAVMFTINPYPDEFLKMHRTWRFGVLPTPQPAATSSPFRHAEKHRTVPSG